MEEEAAAILQSAGLDHAPPLPVKGDLLRPPTPILRHFNHNWPLAAAKNKSKGGLFASAAAAAPPSSAVAGHSNGHASSSTNGKAHAAESKQPSVAGIAAVASAAATSHHQNGGDNWGDDDLDLDIEVDKAAHGKANGGIHMTADANGFADAIDEGDGWGDIEAELDIPPEHMAHAEAAAAAAASDSDVSSFFIAPTTGTSMNDIWCRNSALAADHAAAGNFETAMQVKKKWKKKRVKKKWCLHNLRSILQKYTHYFFSNDKDWLESLSTKQNKWLLILTTFCLPY